MLTIPASAHIYTLSRNNIPAARAKSGDTVRFETLDCYACQIRHEDQDLNALNWDHVNPATGPLFVEGSLPGDVLKVEILSIDLDSQGVMLDRPGRGIPGQASVRTSVKILPVSGGKIHFSSTLSLPARPMIGVIGTAPAGDAVDTGTPDAHGGNMDCTKIQPGATLYLPVNTEGALLAMGDLHASMGDGEVNLCGVEIAGAVTVRLTVLKHCSLPLPFLVDSRIAAAIFSSQRLEDACSGAVMAMHAFLTSQLHFSQEEAGMLLSAAGNLRICQIVDPKMTCRMELPMSVPESCGYHFP